MVKLEIDGKKIEAPQGAMLIEVADEAGISIPRFCYHKKLSVAANCRMCLVEVEKAAKPLPACATPVTDGMRVFTRSPKALEAQRGVMEFLLINHPLDCPICDQGGECELQDISMGYGASHSRFAEKKRVVKDKNLGPLIATDMTRCIHCTRCVRFGQEIGGIKELGATGRGEHMEIGTYVERTVNSEMSGNVIDLCPVGALTSKPFRYQARAWEMQHRPTIAAHDCIGSNITVHVKMNRRVMRVVPRENDAINETWISDRDRFSYEGLNSEDRLTRPMIRRDGQWREVPWDVALEYTTTRLKSILERHGASQLGALLSPSATLEEMFLTQKLLRGLGCANIDHRLRQLDFDDQHHAPVFPSLGGSIEQLQDLDSLLLIGANVRKDQPIAGHRIRQAALKGARIMAINPVDYRFHFPVAAQRVCGLTGMVTELAAVAKAVSERRGVAVPEEARQCLRTIAVNETHRHMAQVLCEGQHSAVILGLAAHGHPSFGTLRALALLISKMSGARLGYLTDGANAAGGWLAGAVPHRGPGGTVVAEGLHVRDMIESRLKAYFLLGIEPELDCGDGAVALKAMQGAEFVVALTPFRSVNLLGYASVLLPSAPFTETSGTFVNVEGRWQSFAAAVPPLEETRPAWKILRVLGNMLDVSGFDYVSSEEVLDEMQRIAGEVTAGNDVDIYGPKSLEAPSVSELLRIAEVAPYAVDGIVRRATALQQTADAQTQQSVKISLSLAQRLGLKDATMVVARQNDASATLPLTIDPSLPDDCVVLTNASSAAATLGCSGTPIELSASGN